MSAQTRSSPEPLSKRFRNAYENAFQWVGVSLEVLALAFGGAPGLYFFQLGTVIIVVGTIEMDHPRLLSLLTASLAAIVSHYLAEPVPIILWLSLVAFAVDRHARNKRVSRVVQLPLCKTDFCQDFGRPFG